MCVHYWRIDQYNHGICKYCLAEQDFPNYYDIGDLRGKFPTSVRTKAGKEGPVDTPPRPDGVKSLKCDHCEFETLSPGALGAHKLGRHKIAGKSRPLTKKQKTELNKLGPEEYCRVHAIAHPQQRAAITGRYMSRSKARKGAPVSDPAPAAASAEASTSTPEPEPQPAPVALEVCFPAGLLQSFRFEIIATDTIPLLPAHLRWILDNFCTGKVMVRLIVELTPIQE